MKILDNISRIELLTTRSCNMRCTYCYQNKSKNSVFTTDTASSILELIKNNPNITNIDLFGGESLLPEIKDNIMKFLKDLSNIRTNISFYITTNGLESDKILDILDFIIENFDYITLQISLDGGKQAHDACRLDTNSKGTFDRIFQNMITLFERYKNNDKIHFYIHHVISLQNVQYIIDTVCFDNALIKEYPDVSISYNSEHSIKVKPHNEAILIEALEFLHDMYLKNDLNCKIWDRFIHADSYFQESHSKCNLMKYSITVDPDGDLFPCHFFSKNSGYDFYNINTKELNSDKYNKALKFIDNRSVISELGYDCRSCVAKGFCAHCMAESWLSTNETDNSIVGSTACSYAHTIGNWVINTYNSGKRTMATEEERTEMLNTLLALSDKVEKECTDELLRVFLFYKVKCKINGVYEI